MRLSPSFSLSEFTRSQTATRHQHTQKPTPVHINNMRRLCDNILEPLRQQIGLPIHISSGFRDAWLNGKIGGSWRSAHMDGRAADIYVRNMSPRTLAEIIQISALQFDKMILEFPDDDGWIHIQDAKSAEPMRRRILTATHAPSGSLKRVIYTEGVI